MFMYIYVHMCDHFLFSVHVFALVCASVDVYILQVYMPVCVRWIIEYGPDFPVASGSNP